MDIATSRSTLGEAISKFIKGIAIMGMHMNEVNTTRLPSDKKDGGRKAGEVRVAPIAPHSLGGVGGKERIGTDGDVAGWAGNHHPDQCPENGSELHAIAVTHRIPLHNQTRARSFVEQRTQKMESGRALTNNDDRPAEQRSGASASRRRSRAVSVEEEPGDPGKRHRGASTDGITCSGMDVAGITQISAEMKAGRSTF